MKLKDCKATLIRKVLDFGLPTKAACYHKMENKKEVIFQTKYNVFSDPPDSDYPFSLYNTYFRFIGAKEKRVYDPDLMEDLSNNTGLQTFYVNR